MGPNSDTFLLRARHVPYVAKRSSLHEISVMNIDDRPTIDLRSWKSLPGRTSNGHISATDHPIHLVPFILTLY